jgi:hypothetical protein
LSLGALLNTFIIVADSRCLLALFEKKAPQLWRPFARAVGKSAEKPWPQRHLAELYRSIPSLDFSKDILESAVDELWVYPVPPCGWSDLGTPQRLDAHFVRHGRPAPQGKAGAATIEGHP